jgi:hypothetical protein
VKRVFSTHNLQLAHHKKNLLEAAGIRATVRNEMLSSAMGELPPAETLIEVWVDEKDYEKAQPILLTVPAGPDWKCGCGETLGGQFTQCWNCGAYKPA